MPCEPILRGLNTAAADAQAAFAITMKTG